MRKGIMAKPGAALLLLTLAAPATAQWSPDRALRTQTVKDAEGGEISCTFYRDFMVRVPGTDTPSPGDALLVRAGKTPPICSARQPAGVSLKTGGYAFLGRTGIYLFFEEADSNGSVAFAVLDSRTGRTIIDDVTPDGIADPSSIHSIAATPETLKLAFRRALNAQCSVLARPGPCWREITGSKDNDVPPAIARLAPPAQACARSYRAAGIPNDDPSIITYEVQVSWTQGGGRRVQAAGPVGCLPMP
ncbi:hypothetical protein [Sphingomonas endolithica]|uniref:hypothetical protein n=1 Tax=Sphingomonas endolithica TaxID=2972485 RepID=UPI0021AE7562|nr:hypothetical protein [Sphingomonas sp. ZFBP2030]